MTSWSEIERKLYGELENIKLERETAAYVAKQLYNIIYYLTNNNNPNKNIKDIKRLNELSYRVVYLMRVNPNLKQNSISFVRWLRNYLIEIKEKNGPDAAIQSFGEALNLIENYRFSLPEARKIFKKALPFLDSK